MSADKEWHGGETVSLHWFYGEEEVVGGPVFEIVDGCVILKVQTATSGTE